MSAECPRLDAHQHFWRYSAAEYAWIGEGLEALRRDFLPADLAPALARAGLDGCLAVQARQSLEETRWLLSLAGPGSPVRGVVGWAPLADPRAPGLVDELAAAPRLRGLRHVVQDEPDPGFLLGAAFNEGVEACGRAGLVYEILVFSPQLPAVLEFADRHPRQRLVLDHLGKPRAAAAELEPGAGLVRELARRPHVSCKLSGLVTEAGRGAWSPAGLRPYFEVVLEAFGPGRLMFGSDWPVCLAATDYGRWVECVESWTAGLSAPERGRVWGGTAMEVYGL